MAQHPSLTPGAPLRAPRQKRNTVYLTIFGLAARRRYLIQTQYGECFCHRTHFHMEWTDVFFQEEQNYVLAATVGPF